MDNFQRPFSPKDLAAALGCSRHTIDCAIKNKTIPAARIGRRYFIPFRVAAAILEDGSLLLDKRH